MTTCDVLDFDAQMVIWGWAVVDTEPDLRRAVRNPVSVLERLDLDRFGWWDGTVETLAATLVSSGSGSWTSPPPWHALPALAEWAMRQSHRLVDHRA